MLAQRLFFGIILIVLLVGLLAADDWLGRFEIAEHIPALSESMGLVRSEGMLVALVLAALVILGTRELLKLFSAAGYAPLQRWTVFANLFFLAIPFIAGNRLRAASDLDDLQWTLNGLIVAFFGICLLVAARRKTDGAVGAIGASLAVVLYLGLLPQFIIRIRVHAGEGAAWLLLYYLFTVKLCDIGAYLTGRFAGRRKLIEWLSPKKTIEGLVGGVAASVLFAVGIPMILRASAASEWPVVALLPPPIRCASFGILMALLGQAGDLLESLIKREARAKDSANAIPAFGGVLDILDSVLLTAPVAYWILLK